MYDEISAGIILTRNISNQEGCVILLLRHSAGHWDFPKGNIELGETEVEAAIRELKEETGIIHFRIMPSFRHTITYNYRRSQKNISKKVTLFLGITDIKCVILSNEHVDYTWEYIDQSYELVRYKNTIRSLENVRNFLHSNITKGIYY